MKTLQIGFILLLLGVQLAYSQSDDWEVVVLAPSEQAILILAPESVSERIPVPDEVSGQVVLSPDRRYLTFNGTNTRYDGQMGEFVQVADLVEQECCITVTSSLEP